METQKLSTNFKTFLANTLKNGGCSYNSTTGEMNPKDGFMNAIPNKEKVIDLNNEQHDKLKVLTKALLQFIYDNVDLIMQNTSLFIGSWYNKLDGKVYFDLSEKVTQLDDAISLAKERKQFAIWDNANITEIRVYDAICKTENDLIKAIKDTNTHVIYYNDKQIRIPNPQTSGTEYQKQTYINNVVRKIVETGTYY